MFIIHFKKKYRDDDSNLIGIKEWLAPQISEHCPKKIPVRLIKKFVWFNRPGVASILIPNEGIVHECNTSAAVTKIRVWKLNGIIMLLSVSNNRKLLLFNELNI